MIESHGFQGQYKMIWNKAERATSIAQLGLAGHHELVRRERREYEEQIANRAPSPEHASEEALYYPAETDERASELQAMSDLLRQYAAEEAKLVMEPELVRIEIFPAFQGETAGNHPARNRFVASMKNLVLGSLGTSSPSTPSSPDR
jgi:hypothetical protein